MMRINRTFFLIEGILLLAAFYIWQTRLRIDFNDLTVQQLLDQGFYVYLLDPEIAADKGLNRKIHMAYWNYHCIKQDIYPNWNPIYIAYYKEDPRYPLLSIYLSPQDALFDNRMASSIDINTPLFSTTNYYIAEGTHEFEFITPTGLELVVSSQLSFDQTVELLNALIVVGEIADGHPWEDMCDS